MGEPAQGHDVESVEWICSYCGHNPHQCDQEDCLCDRCCKDGPWRQ